jgi:broad specificity phosphatase PhoE
VHVYLVRHAQSEGNANAACRVVDCDLTDLGRHQATLAAAELAGMGITHILSSPYKRTVATAREIAKATGAPLALLPALHEHHGLMPLDWTPPSLSELLWQYPDLGVLSGTPETGWHRLPETPEAVYERMQAVVERLRADYAPADRLVLVAHASPIQQFIAAATGSYTAQEATRLVIGNASVTVLDFGASPARLETLARTDFLNVPEPVLL